MNMNKLSTYSPSLSFITSHKSMHTHPSIDFPSVIAARRHGSGDSDELNHPKKHGGRPCPSYVEDSSGDDGSDADFEEEIENEDLVPHARVVQVNQPKPGMRRPPQPSATRTDDGHMPPPAQPPIDGRRISMEPPPLLGRQLTLSPG